MGDSYKEREYIRNTDFSSLREAIATFESHNSYGFPILGQQYTGRMRGIYKAAMWRVGGRHCLESVDSADAVNQAMKACQKDMDAVGKRFEEGEYSVDDLRPLWAIKARFSTRPNRASKTMVFLVYTFI